MASVYNPYYTPQNMRQRIGARRDQFGRVGPGATAAKPPTGLSTGGLSSGNLAGGGGHDWTAFDNFGKMNEGVRAKYGAPANGQRMAPAPVPAAPPVSVITDIADPSRQTRTMQIPAKYGGGVGVGKVNGGHRDSASDAYAANVQAGTEAALAAQGGMDPNGAPAGMPSSVPAMPPGGSPFDRMANFASMAGQASLDQTAETEGYVDQDLQNRVMSGFSAPGGATSAPITSPAVRESDTAAAFNRPAPVAAPAAPAPKASFYPGGVTTGTPPNPAAGGSVFYPGGVRPLPVAKDYVSPAGVRRPYQPPIAREMPVAKDYVSPDGVRRPYQPPTAHPVQKPSTKLPRGTSVFDLE